MEKDDIVVLGKRVSEDKYLIAQLIQEEAYEKFSRSGREVTVELAAEALKIRADFVELLGNSIQQYWNEQAIHQKIRDWGEWTGNYFLEQGLTLEVALAETSLYRKHIGKVVKTEALQQKMSVETLFDTMEFFHVLLDQAAYSYSSAYINSYQRKISVARQEFLQFSSPVVPVSDHIAILPLVGDIELDRAQYILEQTLQSAGRLQISTLIIDLSGVIKVDSMVAEQIITIIHSLKLLGVHAVLTGIRPEIAQTLTALGVDVRTLTVGGSLKRALEQLNFNK